MPACPGGLGGFDVEKVGSDDDWPPWPWALPPEVGGGDESGTASEGTAAEGTAAEGTAAEGAAAGGTALPSVALPEEELDIFVV